MQNSQNNKRRPVTPSLPLFLSFSRSAIENVFNTLIKLLTDGEIGAFPSLVNFTLVSRSTTVRYFITMRSKPIRETRNNRMLAS